MADSPAKPYEEWAVEDLEHELESRGLETSGYRVELIQRLQEDDQSDRQHHSRHDDEHMHDAADTTDAAAAAAYDNDEWQHQQQPDEEQDPDAEHDKDLYGDLGPVHGHVHHQNEGISNQQDHEGNDGEYLDFGDEFDEQEHQETAANVGAEHHDADEDADGLAALQDAEYDNQKQQHQQARQQRQQMPVEDLAMNDYEPANYDDGYSNDAAAGEGSDDDLGKLLEDGEADDSQQQQQQQQKQQEQQPKQQSSKAGEAEKASAAGNANAVVAAPNAAAGTRGLVAKNAAHAKVPTLPPKPAPPKPEWELMDVPVHWIPQPIVRVSGIPASCTAEEVQEVLTGPGGLVIDRLDIAPANTAAAAAAGTGGLQVAYVRLPAPPDSWKTPQQAAAAATAAPESDSSADKFAADANEARNAAEQQAKDVEQQQQQSGVAAETADNKASSNIAGPASQAATATTLQGAFDSETVLNARQRRQLKRKQYLQHKQAAAAAGGVRALQDSWVVARAAVLSLVDKKLQLQGHLITFEAAMEQVTLFIAGVLESESALQHLLEPFGQLVRCFVVRNPQGQSKHYAFAEFALPGQALAALRAINKRYGAYATYGSLKRRAGSTAVSGASSPAATAAEPAITPDRPGKRLRQGSSPQQQLQQQVVKTEDQKQSEQQRQQQVNGRAATDMVSEEEALQGLAASDYDETEDGDATAAEQPGKQPAVSSVAAAVKVEADGSGDGSAGLEELNTQLQQHMEGIAKPQREDEQDNADNSAGQDTGIQSVQTGQHEANAASLEDEDDDMHEIQDGSEDSGQQEAFAAAAAEAAAQDNLEADSKQQHTGEQPDDKTEEVHGGMGMDGKQQSLATAEGVLAAKQWRAFFSFPRSVADLFCHSLQLVGLPAEAKSEAALRHALSRYGPIVQILVTMPHNRHRWSADATVEFDNSAAADAAYRSLLGLKRIPVPATQQADTARAAAAGNGTEAASNYDAHQEEQVDMLGTASLLHHLKTIIVPPQGAVFVTAADPDTAYGTDDNRSPKQNQQKQQNQTLCVPGVGVVFINPAKDAEKRQAKAAVGSTAAAAAGPRGVIPVPPPPTGPKPHIRGKPIGLPMGLVGGVAAAAASAMRGGMNPVVVGGPMQNPMQPHTIHAMQQGFMNPMMMMGRSRGQQQQQQQQLMAMQQMQVAMMMQRQMAMMQQQQIAAAMQQQQRQQQQMAANASRMGNQTGVGAAAASGGVTAVVGNAVPAPPIKKQAVVGAGQQGMRGGVTGGRSGQQQQGTAGAGMGQRQAATQQQQPLAQRQQHQQGQWPGQAMQGGQHVLGTGFRVGGAATGQQQAYGAATNQQQQQQWKQQQQQQQQAANLQQQQIGQSWQQKQQQGWQHQQGAPGSGVQQQQQQQQQTWARQQRQQQHAQQGWGGTGAAAAGAAGVWGDEGDDAFDDDFGFNTAATAMTGTGYNQHATQRRQQQQRGAITQASRGQQGQQGPYGYLYGQQAAAKQQQRSPLQQQYDPQLDIDMVNTRHTTARSAAQPSTVAAGGAGAGGFGSATPANVYQAAGGYLGAEDWDDDDDFGTAGYGWGDEGIVSTAGGNISNAGSLGGMGDMQQQGQQKRSMHGQQAGWQQQQQLQQNKATMGGFGGLAKLGLGGQYGSNGNAAAAGGQQQTVGGQGPGHSQPSSRFGGQASSQNAGTGYGGSDIMANTGMMFTDDDGDVLGNTYGAGVGYGGTGGAGGGNIVGQGKIGQLMQYGNQQQHAQQAQRRLLQQQQQHGQVAGGSSLPQGYGGAGGDKVGGQQGGRTQGSMAAGMGGFGNMLQQQHGQQQQYQRQQQGQGGAAYNSNQQKQLTQRQAGYGNMYNQQWG